MAITQQQVEHIARLSRLSLSPEELPRYGEQLGRILGYIEQLGELDTEGVEPASHALPLVNVARADQVREYDLAELRFEARSQFRAERAGIASPCGQCGGPELFFGGGG